MKETVFKVGDKVFHLQHGWGKVTNIDTKQDYPITVIFNDINSYCFTEKGCMNAWDNLPTLSFTEYTLQGFSQERPIELPEVGEEIMVSLGGGKHWVLGTFIEYRPAYQFPVVVSIDGQEEDYAYFKRLK